MCARREFLSCSIIVTRITHMVSNVTSGSILFNFSNSGAPAARRTAKRSPIIIEKGTTRMHRNRNPCNSFLMVKMASGMDHARVRPTTTTTNDDDERRRRQRRTTTKNGNERRRTTWRPSGKYQVMQSWITAFSKIQLVIYYLIG